MESVVQMIRGLSSDLQLLAVLLLPLVAGVRLAIGSIQKAAGSDDALIVAWRDVIIATVSMVLAGIFKIVAEGILSPQSAEVWRVFR